MIDIEEIFRYKVPDQDKLFEYGFEYSEELIFASYELVAKK